MKCKNCTLFKQIGNTEESGYGICSYGSNWDMTTVDTDCSFVPEAYKCKHCIHFVEHDTACMIAHAEDEICCGFEDVKFYQLVNILTDWNMRGIDIQEKINKALYTLEDIDVPKERA